MCTQTLPEAPFALLTKLRALNISLNAISGPLPSSWTTLTDLASLDLSFNNLTGVLPPAWMIAGSFTALSTLNLQSNSLRGTVPSGLSALTKLQV